MYIILYHIIFKKVNHININTYIILNMDKNNLLISTVRNWVKLDNEIKALQKEQNTRKKEKKEISNSLINVMKSNDIDCFDLNDGQLCYNKKDIKKPLTKKALLNILSKYYDDDVSKANELNDFILENRETTLKESITRKMN